MQMDIMKTVEEGSSIAFPLRGGHCAITTQAAVATASPQATEAAVEVLREGGNAIDAAVAAAWVLAVSEPSGSGLGGQTSLLIRFANGDLIALDGHSRAPETASLNAISRDQQRVGYRACTIPSTPATLGSAHRRYGVLAPARVLRPAIHLAEEGYAVTPLLHRQMEGALRHLRAYPSFGKFFLNQGRLFQVGDLFRQRELAATLSRLADCGTEDFYRGAIARLIVKDMQEQGGLMTERDLAENRSPIEREPLVVDYRGYRLHSLPSPGGGLQLLLAFKILERLAPFQFGSELTDWYQWIAQAVYAVFWEREKWPVEMECVSPMFRKWLLSDVRAQQIALAIERNPNSAAKTLNPAAAEKSAPEELSEKADEALQGAAGWGEEEAGETSHLCVADRFGNIVSLTQSIQSLFGAKVAHAQLGFLYNNYLCTCPRDSHPGRLRSRCTPQSNAAPTIILRDTGKPFLVLGAAGSRRIISSILQAASGIIDRGLSVEEAIEAPRVHALLSRKAWIESPALSEELRERLERNFVSLEIKAPHDFKLGAVQAIHFGEDGAAHGTADPRREGTAKVLEAGETLREKGEGKTWS
jgi:gamma-glutamyltranspeptidase / glutathione hydrolase